MIALKCFVGRHTLEKYFNPDGYDNVDLYGKCTHCGTHILISRKVAHNYIPLSVGIVDSDGQALEEYCSNVLQRRKTPVVSYRAFPKLTLLERQTYALELIAENTQKSAPVDAGAWYGL